MAGRSEIYEVRLRAVGGDEIIEVARKARTALRGVGAEVKQTGTVSKAATKDVNDFARSFRNIIIRTVAVVGVLRTLDAIRGVFGRLVSGGLEYNETLETATLSIASLITATSELRTANGEVVTGVDALNTAYGLAEDQIQKLRIAGIQTAATTQELVDAFQQAVGAGLQTGLTLDQIRQVTIRLTQAAGALGVPYRQLNEEIRSLFTGNITQQNTRIATALGITNADINRAKQTGELAEFLLDRFDAFGVAGDRIVETWSALKSTIQETVEIISGVLVRPLFDSLRVTGLEQVQRLFDFDTAQIADEFLALVDAGQLFFQQIGLLASDAITGFVNLLEEANLNADDLADSFFSIGDSVRRIAEAAGTLSVNIAKSVAEGGKFSDVLETVADTLELIVNNAFLLKATLFGLTVAVGAGIAAVLGPTAGLITAAAGGAAILASQIDKLVVSQSELVREQRQANEQSQQQRTRFNDEATSVALLTEQYKAAAEALRNATEGTEEYADAQGRLQSARASLEEIGFGDVFEQLDSDADRVAYFEELVRRRTDAIQKEGQTIRSELEQTQQRADELQQKIQDNQRWLVFGRVANTLAERELAELERLLESLNRSLAENEAAQAELERIRTTGGVVLSPRGAESGENAALKAFQARLPLATAQIKAALAEEEESLKDSLERRLISYEDYWDAVSEARDRATAQLVALQQELIGLLDDPKAIAAAQAQIVKLQSDRAIQRSQELRELDDNLEKLEDKFEDISSRLAQRLGDSATAVRQKWERELEELIDRLRRAGRDADAAVVEAFINEESLAAQFSDIQAVINRAQQTLQDSLNTIQVEEQFGGISDNEARRRTIASYEQLRQVILDNRDALIALREASDSPTLIVGVDRLLEQLAQLEIRIEGLRSKWRQFLNQFEEILETNITDFLTDAVLEAENLGQAFRNLGNVRSLLAAIAADLLRIVSQLIAAEIAAKAIRALGGIGGGSEGGLAGAIAAASSPGARDGGLVPAFAAGGRVRGPGGPRADKVLARLSAGEYVIRAASVRKFGVDFMNQINRGALPREIRGFRDGGMVQALPGGGTSGTGQRDSADLRGELKIGLREGLVVDSMKGPEGKRLILSVITENRRGVRRSLGL